MVQPGLPMRTPFASRCSELLAVIGFPPKCMHLSSNHKHWPNEDADCRERARMSLDPKVKQEFACAACLTLQEQQCGKH